jgi:hypothetical protein
VTTELSADELAFLRRHGFDEHAEVISLRGGANNRLFRIGNGGQCAVLKRYFHTPGETHDRFQAEQRFYAHALEVAPELVPRALGWAREISCALFAHVPGERLRADEIQSIHVARACDFIARLNAPPRPAFEPASDSAFSVADNHASIQRRIDRLGAIRPETESHQRAIELVRAELLPRWERISRALKAREMTGEAVCHPEEKIISPSDFGFHNALRDADGALLFLDFEYAGEDDPAKMICDFFSQPEIPVPVEFLPAFSEPIISLLPKSRQGACRTRIEILRPMIALKWCCIMLNDFLPAGQVRRAFALPVEELRVRQQSQVVRVAAYLQKNLE